MYYPPEYNKDCAIELAELSSAAYKQFDHYKINKTYQGWKPPNGYTLVTPILYRALLSFDATDESSLSPFEREVQHLPEPPNQGDSVVSFGIGETITEVFGQDIPIGFVATKGKNAYLVFRGTNTVGEWLFDLSMGLVPYILPDWGHIASGFMDLYKRIQGTYMKKLAALGSSCTNLYITGHSLGGAMSVVSLPDVIKSTSFKKPIQYTFGCPRVGDASFVKAYDAQPGQKTFRVVNTCDVIPSMPLPVPMPVVPSGYYSHVGVPIDFTSQFDDVGKNHSVDMYIDTIKAG